MAKADNTKIKLLTVAAKLFHQYGFEKTSMDEIAKIAHKAKGSLYYHFSSKEDLFHAIMEKELNTLKTKLLPILADDSLTEIERINMYIVKRMEILNSTYAYHELIKNDFIDYRGVQSNAIDNLRKSFDEWEHSQFVSLLQKAIDRKCLDVHLQAETMAKMLLLVLRSLEVQFFIKNEYTLYKDTFDALIVIIMKGLVKEYRQS